MKRKKHAVAILAAAVIALVVLWTVAPPESMPAAASSRLVSIREFPSQLCEWDGELTERAPLQIASLKPQALFAALLVAPRQETSDPWRMEPPLDAANVVTRPPDSRTLGDTYPTYTSVGVNLQTDEVVLQDNNLWSARVFNRLDNTPANAAMTQPKRVIQGQKTLLEYNNGLYIDQTNGDI